MIHLTKVRELSPADFDESTLPLMKKQEHSAATWPNFNRWGARRGQPQGSAPAKGPDAKAFWHGSGESEDSRDRRRREDSPQGKKRVARLEDLRKELRKAEKQAEGIPWVKTRGQAEAMETRNVKSPGAATRKGATGSLRAHQGGDGPARRTREAAAGEGVKNPPGRRLWHVKWRRKRRQAI